MFACVTEVDTFHSPLAVSESLLSIEAVVNRLDSYRSLPCEILAVVNESERVGAFSHRSQICHFSCSLKL